MKLTNLRSIKFYIENKYLKHQSGCETYNMIGLVAPVLHDCFASFLDPGRPSGCAKLQFQLSVQNDKVHSDSEWRRLGAKNEDWLAGGLNNIFCKGGRGGHSRPKGFWEYHGTRYIPLDRTLASSTSLI